RPFGDPETVQLSPGDTVLLYTDGLVERRDRDVVAGIELLMETAAAVDVPLADLPAVLVRSLGSQAADDDVALLVARVATGLSAP
ncbi:MAG TPA: SpoIIE family protein phosphatase, partial [Nocardioides sp.]|nr:SpoIIE family protein phosphatase [Nocardioides sp.]